MNSFSLLYEKWIPVEIIKNDEESTSRKKPEMYRDIVSLRDTLLSPQKYRRINAEHALQTAALYRLHLAILHRALKGPTNIEQAAQWYLEGFPQDELEEYLQQYADRFDLFGPKPFLQVVGLDTAPEGEKLHSHWTRLSGIEGSPNTTALFNQTGRPNGERSDSISPQQAALQLLENQSFVLGGLIKRFTTSARAAPVATAALFMAEDENDLQKTFCLNLVPYNSEMQKEDLPPWERDVQHVDNIRDLYNPEKPQPVNGYASRYTWLSRSILLMPQETPNGTQISTICFAAGEPLNGLGEGADANTDPMVTLRETAQLLPYKLRRDRLFWRDMDALLPNPAQKTEFDKKGKIKIQPGRAPRTLKHARELMQQVMEQQEEETQAATEPEEFVWTDEDTPDAPKPHPIIPMMVFGQLTDQGKAFAMRQESYTLPKNLFKTENTNPSAKLFRDNISIALQDATTVGDALKQSVYYLANELLKKGGDREPHKDDVTKLTSQIAADQTYWAQLDSPFRWYLKQLDSDVSKAKQDWRLTLQKTALTSWYIAEEAAGMNSIGLRASEKARANLMHAIRTFKAEVQ